MTVEGHGGTQHLHRIASECDFTLQLGKGEIVRGEMRKGFDGSATLSRERGVDAALGVRDEIFACSVEKRGASVYAATLGWGC